MSINKRVFGSDIPFRVKRTLQARQELADRDRNPYDEIGKVSRDKDNNLINDVDKSLAGDDGILSYSDLIGSNFNGVADLSSRTPFVRMWVGFELFEKTVMEGKLPEDSESTNQDFYVFGDSSENFTTSGEWYSSENVENISITEGEPVIYSIGNNIDNQEELNPFEQRQRGSSADNLVDLALPLEYQTNRNEFFEPPAGIISVQSETQGTLGTIKKTTVTFQVGNFIDYDKIYSKYFLRPGAQIFVDFGWDTADLYKPKDLLQGICPDYDEKEKSPTYPNNLEKCLYSEKTFEIDPNDANKIVNKGFDGYVTKSNGQMETLVGIVTNYNSKINADGTVTCEVTITSKNSALVNQQGLEQQQRDMRFDYLFQQTVLFNGLFLRLGGLQQVIKPGASVNNPNKELLELLKRIAYASNTSKVEMRDFGTTLLYKMGIISSEELPEKYQQLNNDTIVDNLDFKLSLDYGITDDSIQTGVLGGKIGDENEIFISLGHLEDFILNPEFGFLNIDNRSKSQKNSNKIDEDDITNQKSFEVKFDSSLSWTTWSEQLENYQKALLSNVQSDKTLPSMLFPEWWGSIKGKSATEIQTDYEVTVGPLENKDHNHVDFEHGHAWNQDPDLLEQTIADGGYSTDGFIPPPGDNNTHTIFEPTQQYEGDENRYIGGNLRPHEMPHTKDLPDNERAPWFYTGSPPGDNNSNPIHTHEQLIDFETGGAGGGIVPMYRWRNASATQGYQPDTCAQNCATFGYTCTENGCPTINFDLYGTEAEYNGGGVFYEGSPYHENWSGEPPTQYSCEDTLPVRNIIPALNPASDDPFGQSVDCCCVKPSGGAKIGGINFTRTIFYWPDAPSSDERLIRFWKCFQEGIDTPGQFIDDSMWIEEGSDFGPQDCCEMMMDGVDGYVVGEVTLNTNNGNNYIENKTDVFSQTNISGLQLWADDDKAANGVVFRGYDCLVNRPQTSYVETHRNTISHEHPMKELNQPASTIRSEYEIISSYNSKYQTNFSETWKHEFFKFYTQDEIEIMSSQKGSSDYIYHDLNQFEYDKIYKRIPLREVFFNAKSLKQALTGISKNGKSDVIGVTQALQTFFDRINKDYRGVFNFKVTSGGGEDNTIAITDLNVPAIKFQQKLHTDDDIFENLFEFNVRQKNSIVKSYDINFDLGSGAIGNIMAIRGMTNKSQILPLTEVLDTVSALEAIDTLTEQPGDNILSKSVKNFFVKYLPDMGNSQHIANSERQSEERYINRGFTYVGDILGTSFGNLSGTDNETNFANTLPEDLHTFSTIDEILASSTDVFKNLSATYFNHHIIEWENSTDDTSSTASSKDKQIPFKQFTSLYQDFSSEALGKTIIPETFLNPKGGTYKYRDVEDGMKDMTLRNRELELQKQISTVSDIKDYYLKEAILEAAFGRDTLLPIKLNLTVYGISSLVPGDIFKVDYLPERYKQNVYFQVIQISNQIGVDGWYTTLTTQWRTRADKRRKSNVIKIDKFALDPSSMQNGGRFPSRLIPGIHNMQRLVGANILKADVGGFNITNLKLFYSKYHHLMAGQEDNNQLNIDHKIDNVFKFKWLPEGNTKSNIQNKKSIKFYGGIIPYFIPTVQVGKFTKTMVQNMATANFNNTFDAYNPRNNTPLEHTAFDLENSKELNEKYGEADDNAVIPGSHMLYEYLGKEGRRLETENYKIMEGSNLLDGEKGIWNDVIPTPKSSTLKYDMFDELILEDVYDEGKGSSYFSIGTNNNHYSPGDPAQSGVNILAPMLDDSFGIKEYTTNAEGDAVFGDKTKEFLLEKLGKDFNLKENQKINDLDYAKALLHLIFSKEKFTYKNTKKIDGRDHMLRIGHYLNLNPGETYYLLQDSGKYMKTMGQNWLVIPEIAYNNPQVRRFCYYMLNGWMNQGNKSPYWYNSNVNAWFYQQTEIDKLREYYMEGRKDRNNYSERTNHSEGIFQLPYLSTSAGDFDDDGNFDLFPDDDD